MLLVFGCLAIALGYTDVRKYKIKPGAGKERISRRLTKMVGGTIAIITAGLVVNPPFEPEWVWWMLPTVLITPVIFWWNFKILKWNKKKLQSLFSAKSQPTRLQLLSTPIGFKVGEIVTTEQDSLELLLNKIYQQHIYDTLFLSACAVWRLSLAGTYAATHYEGSC